MPDLRNRLLTRITAPSEEPVTLAEAKLYLRVTQDDEDTLINDLIVSARMAAEHWLRRSLVTQSWKLAYDDYIPHEVALPMGPVDSIDGVVIVNRDSTTQSVDSNLYYLNAAKDMLVADTALVGFRVEITYIAGYGTAANVPSPIKQGMLAHIADLYDHRGEADVGLGLPSYTASLYLPFRGMSL